MLLTYRLPDYNLVDVSGRIKELLQPMLDVPVSKMQLSGWVNKYDGRMADDVSTDLLYF